MAMSESGGDNFQYTLRSRKPKMVPYTHSNGPSASIMVDVIGHHSSGKTVPPDPADSKEKAGYRSGDRPLANGRPGYRDRLDNTDDKGGGGTNNSDDGSKDDDHDRDITDMRETSFIQDGDTQPLLDASDSEEEVSTAIMVKESSETSLQICMQVTLPYIIAGFGMVAAGMVLDIVQVSFVLK